MEILEKEKRINTELASLKKLYADVAPNKKQLAYKLCEKAAFLKVSLEECQDDINEKGYYESFQQSRSVDPYDRTRPVVNTFASLTASYQKYMKQLADMLPEDKQKERGDGFEEFVDAKE